ncbi:MAG: DUF2127 domain-containing protein [Chthoniobacterales bacterium]
MKTDHAASRRHHNKGLLTIAIFKFMKGCLLVLLALGFLRLLHRDVAHTVIQIANAMRVDPGNRYLASLLEQARLINDRGLAVMSGLTFCYSSLFFVEGVGLFLEKRWAEWLTIIATASFLPLEVYEIFRHVTLIKIVALIVNLTIVAVLVLIVRRDRPGHH